MCLEEWRCNYILDTIIKLGVEWSSPTPLLFTSGELTVLRICQKGSSAQSDYLNGAEKRKPLPRIEPGYSCSLGRGLVNN
jgi:hypothetical protein